MKNPQQKHKVPEVILLHCSLSMMKTFQDGAKHFSATALCHRRPQSTLKLSKYKMLFGNSCPWIFLKNRAIFKKGEGGLGGSVG